MVMLTPFCSGAFAQADPAGSYPKNDLEHHHPLAYPPLREADVVFCKRIERIIDTREKKNAVMNWPKNPLSAIVHDLVDVGDSNSVGELMVYRNDSLANPMLIKDINHEGQDCETVSIWIGPGPYDYKDTTICTNYDFSQIKRWEIVEDWIFDKQSSQFFPRIVAIAPLYSPALNGVALNEQPMFYISWAKIRPFLAKEEIFNRESDVRISYLDFFEQRLFSSYITKESNDKDLAIKDMPEFKTNPMEALYESQRIKEELINKEQGLWEY